MLFPILLIFSSCFSFSLLFLTSTSPGAPSPLLVGVMGRPDARTLISWSAPFAFDCGVLCSLTALPFLSHFLIGPKRPTLVFYPEFHWMLLRVRGVGGSAENSQGILMALRGFRLMMERAPTTYAPRAAVSPLRVSPFNVSLDATRAPRAACARELWNLYDVAYDEADERIAVAGKTVGGGCVPLVFHSLTRVDEVASAEAVVGHAEADSRSSASTLCFDLRLAFGGEGAKVPYGTTQLLAWEVALAMYFFPALAAALTASGPQVCLLLFDETDSSEVEDARRHLTVFYSALLSRLLRGLGESVEVTVVRSLESVPASADVITTESRVSGWRTLACHKRVFAVPLVDTSVDADIDAQDRREQAVLNFCPCCGPTTPPPPGVEPHRCGGGHGNAEEHSNA